MTALMEQAWAEVSALPEREQDMVAQIILDTIRDEQEWDRQFAGSHDFLDHLADKALADHEAGRTRELP
jgi:hypothetical protein